MTQRSTLSEKYIFAKRSIFLTLKEVQIAQKAHFPLKKKSQRRQKYTTSLSCKGWCFQGLSCCRSTWCTPGLSAEGKVKELNISRCRAELRRNCILLIACEPTSDEIGILDARSHLLAQSAPFPLFETASRSHGHERRVLGQCRRAARFARSCTLCACQHC